MMTHIKAVWTASLVNEVDNITQLRMIRKVLSKLEEPVDLLIFDPDATEDGGARARVGP